MKIAVTKIGNKAWTGGTTYLKNFSGIVKERLKDKISLNLISSFEKIDDDIKKNFDSVIFVKNFKLFSISQILSLNINKIANSHSIKVFFETTEFLGFFCKKKIVTWIPDFQHKYYPNYFSFFSYLKREISFRVKLIIRDRILVSSNNAKEDCMKFYKIDEKKIFVAPFSIDINPSKYVDRYEYLKKKYGISKNYFYIPNQFWRHKNHEIIFNFFENLIKLKIELDNLPEFIFTGLSLDNRNKNFSQKLLQLMKSDKFKGKIKYLGLVPLEDVYTLNANCLALINPSFFEGWSTTVEEAKSLGTKMILSDIKLHREQSPSALFFNPKSTEDFYETIFKFLKDKKNFDKKRDISVINKFSEKRKSEYALAIKDAFTF